MRQKEAFTTASLAVVILLLSTRCTLYSDVSIAPLLVPLTQIDHGVDLTAMVRRSDALRTSSAAGTRSGRSRATVADLTALGETELAAGRFDAARKHLREAVDLEPFRSSLANIEWDLSQVEYLANNYAASLDWAELSVSHGTVIRQWHVDYLRALSGIEVYRFSGQSSEQMRMRIGKPDVPRVEARINGSRSVPAIIDSGAALSIVSQRLASELKIRSLKVERGTFYGLLGEPIAVEFGMIDRLELGAMIVDNVPVAIMPDAKMRFVVTGREQFSMDLLLGANLLKELRVELNFHRATATLTKLSLTGPGPDAGQNMFFEAFRPVVRATVNRHGWFLFVLDTGSEVTFLNETQLGTLPINILAPKMHNAMLQGLGGAQKHGAKLENVEIGADRWAGTFRTIPMYASSDREHAAGILGENFLQNFRVVLDFGRMRVDLFKD